MKRRCRAAAAAVVLSLAVAGSVSAQAGQLPPLPQNAPKVGDKAPDFTLPDTANKPVKLSGLFADPAPNGQKGSWVLLIFYRGYW